MLPKHGLLNIDKPASWTSFDVVRRVTQLLRQKGTGKLKVGHSGTLDPLATGVLVVCFGQATRVASLIQEQTKSYVARFQLGKSTDTDDITGQVLEEKVISQGQINRSDVEQLLPEFTGAIQQVPPQFSAVHVDGRRAYQLARSGQSAQLQPREVHVDEIQLTSFEFPTFELHIVCGSGTYIRAIGRDLGQRLGCGATMTELVRTSIGPFRLESATPLGELTVETIESAVLPTQSAFPHFGKMQINEGELQRVSHGNAISAPMSIAHNETLDVVLLGPDGQLAAIAGFDQNGTLLRPHIVFATND